MIHTFRNGTMAERKFNMDQRKTENTLSSNIQFDLEREYKDDFRDGTRVDAIDAIEAKLSQHKKKGQCSITDQLQAYRLACFIFEVTKTTLRSNKISWIYVSLCSTQLLASLPLPLFGRKGIDPCSVIEGRLADNIYTSVTRLFHVEKL